MTQPVRVILTCLMLALFVSCSVRSRPGLDPEPLSSPTTSTMSSLAPPQDLDYLLQVEDQIEIFFPKAPSMNFQAVVRPDGRITAPQPGDVAAEGLTPEQLGAAIGKLYSDILKDSKAVVSVRQFGPQLLYVFGEVKNPNRFVLQQPMDLLQALTLAGGTLRTAGLDHVVVVRVGSTGAYTYTEYDLKGIRDDAQPNPVWLRPRDIVIVPTSAIADIGIWIDNYINFLLPPLDSFLLGRYYWYFSRNAK